MPHQCQLALWRVRNVVLTERQYRFDNSFISYSEGPDNGPPLVLLHGLTGYWQTFQPILPAFTAWHVYACDLLGHGKSGRAASYRVMDHVHSIVTFIRGQIAQPAVLIGHSLGGL